jgi:hypothetical protein
MDYDHNPSARTSLEGRLFTPFLDEIWKEPRETISPGRPMTVSRVFGTFRGLTRSVCCLEARPIGLMVTIRRNEVPLRPFVDKVEHDDIDAIDDHEA